MIYMDYDGCRGKGVGDECDIGLGLRGESGEMEGQDRSERGTEWRIQ